MSKRKTTKKKTTAKTRTPAAAAATAKRPKAAAEAPAKGQEKPDKKAAREGLCVFAFRLSTEERDTIHKAAGPGKASMFARGLLVAAARKDETALNAIVKHWNPDSR
jgi:hypothetical protein